MTDERKLSRMYSVRLPEEVYRGMVQLSQTTGVQLADIVRAQLAAMLSSAGIEV